MPFPSLINVAQNTSQLCPVLLTHSRGSRIEQSITVDLGLEGALDRDAQVVGLDTGQLGQLHAKLVQVQTRHLLVQLKKWTA